MKEAGCFKGYPASLLAIAHCGGMKEAGCFKGYPASLLAIAHCGLLLDL